MTRDSFHLGAWLIEPSRNRISRNDTVATLEPMSMTALVLLSERAPETVSIDEMLETLWPRTVAESSALHRVIAKLRRALGDSPRDPTYILTVPKRGYRVIAFCELAKTAETMASGTPFVGRSEILSNLEKRLQNCRQGRGSVVLIAGDLGIGKSRTMQEFSEGVVDHGALHCQGWCDETGSTSPLWPWIGILRSLDEDMAIRSMPEHALYADVLANFIPEIYSDSQLATARRDMEAKERRFRTADAICRILKRAASRRPLVIVIDDLHRADESTLLTLAFVAREIAQSRILVLGSYRDTELDVSQPIAGHLADLLRQGAVYRYELAGLSKGEVAELVSLAGGPAELVEPVIAKSDGNPLYVTLLLQSLVDDAATLDIPHGVREIVLGQLARLSENCRHALLAAAIGGRMIDRRLVCSVSNIGRSDMEDALDETRRAGLVTGPNDAPRFSHLLIQETIYSNIGPSRREALHLKTAEEIGRLPHEQMGGATLLDVAQHYASAARPIEAARWYQRAYVWFQDRNDHAAYDCCQRALAQLIDHPGNMNESERAVWVVRTSTNAMHQGMRDQVPIAAITEIYDKAVTYFPYLGSDSPLIPMLITTYSDALAVAGQNELAVEYARSGLSRTEVCSDEALRLHAVLTLIGRLCNMGQLQEAFTLARETVERPPNDRLICMTKARIWYPFPRIVTFCGKALAQLGEPASGLAYIQEALDLLRIDSQQIRPEKLEFPSCHHLYRGVPALLCECLEAATLCYYYLGDLSNMLKCARANLDGFGQSGGIYQASVFRHLLLALCAARDWDQMVSLEQEMKDVHRLDSDPLVTILRHEARINTGEDAAAVIASVRDLIRSSPVDVDPLFFASCGRLMLDRIELVDPAEIDEVLDRFAASIEHWGATSNLPILSELRGRLEYKSN